MIIENTDHDINLNRIKMFILEDRGFKAKIATTNGCFDLLHVGHIRFLQSIKKIADILIVCVNSDDSVRRLKGEGRPIVPLAERMEILDALECVDYVVAFEDNYPCAILDLIKPDIHVKDSTYVEKGIHESETVEKNGGVVVYIGRTEGYSTTDIITTTKLLG